MRMYTKNVQILEGNYHVSHSDILMYVKALNFTLMIEHRIVQCVLLEI